MTLQFLVKLLRIRQTHGQLFPLHSVCQVMSQQVSPNMRLQFIYTGENMTLQICFMLSDETSSFPLNFRSLFPSFLLFLFTHFSCSSFISFLLTFLNFSPLSIKKNLQLWQEKQHSFDWKSAKANRPDWKVNMISKQQLNIIKLFGGSRFIDEWQWKKQS